MAARKTKPKDSDEAVVARYSIDGKDYDLKIGENDIPLRDRIEIEEYLGMPWAQAWGTGWAMSEKGQAYFAYLAVRQRKPSTTLDEILDCTSLKVEYLTAKELQKRPTSTPETSGSPS
jgi:hypothetical protein